MESPDVHLSDAFRLRLGQPKPVDWIEFYNYSDGDFDFGLGKGDSVRLFAPGDANGAEPLREATWPEGTHWGFC